MKSISLWAILSICIGVSVQALAQDGTSEERAKKVEAELAEKAVLLGGDVEKLLRTKNWLGGGEHPKKKMTSAIEAHPELVKDMKEKGIALEFETDPSLKACPMSADTQKFNHGSSSALASIKVALEHYPKEKIKIQAIRIVLTDKKSGDLRVLNGMDKTKVTLSKEADGSKTVTREFLESRNPDVRNEDGKWVYRIYVNACDHETGLMLMNMWNAVSGQHNKGTVETETPSKESGTPKPADQPK